MSWIEIYHKPTNCQQRCQKCKKDLIRGELIAKVITGAYSGHPMFDYFHIECLLKTVKDIIEDGKARLDVGRSFIKKLDDGEVKI